MLETLKQLALMGATRKVLRISSKEIAEKINQSTQTAARKLKELEEAGYLERTISKDGQYIVITEKGRDFLHREYLDYKKIFEELPKTIVIAGKVTSGIGEGAYYVSLEGYRKQFIEKLGFNPFPGTLNLKIPKEQMFFRKLLDRETGIKIEGFSAENRTFGDVKSFRCNIKGVVSAIVIPQRTHYPDNVLEVISPIKLRDELGLKDGDVIDVEVDLC
ncbi:MAG: riboflavin kinase [Archaeoglobus sp.]|nr:MAG: riboflavin kinase [Archaeoglobus sp.]